jgi:hypothetical protein
MKRVGLVWLSLLAFIFGLTWQANAQLPDVMSVVVVFLPVVLMVLALVGGK